MKSPIGVGVIGANPLVPGWATLAHLPALQSAPAFALRAVSTSRLESARAAEARFGVPAHDHHLALIERKDVDLVVVTVRVPHHHEITAAAIATGKMVYTEWPLGNGTAEALDLAQRARDAGVLNVVGLQGRFSPEVEKARDLVQSGALGDILGTSLVGSSISWSGVTTRSQAYLFDSSNGVTPLTVCVLHAIDTLSHVLGELVEVNSTSVMRHAQVHVADEGIDIPNRTHDQVAVIGRLSSGALASIHYRGGVTRGENLRWEINGTKGDLILTSDNGNLQVANLRMDAGFGADAQVTRIEPEARYHEVAPWAPVGMARNVARLYAQIAADLRDGTRESPDFVHAVKRHRLIDTLLRAEPLPVMAA